MAIQSNFPATRPSLLLDFANSKRLDPRITFTRASTARFYDGVTVAKAEENLLTRSQEFDNAAAYIFSRVSVTADQTTAPDGTSTADLLASTTDSGTHILQRLVEFPVVNGLTYTLSVFMKKGTGGTAPDWMQLSFDSSRFGSSQYANYDILNGTVGTTGGGATASIVSFGSGWYRCIFTATATSSANGSINITFTNNSDGAGRAPSYVDATTSDVFIWGAQVEQRSAVTAYTPTTTAPITNYIPVLQTAQAGVPRFDHNPITGESLGLLIEEQRTNLFQRSEEFNNGFWVKLNATISTNATVAPDGTLTADKIVANTTSSSFHGFNNQNATVGVTQTISAYFKAAEYVAVQFLLGGIGGSSATFNLSTGTVANTGGNGTARIEPVGNGWYRCSLTDTVTGNSNSQIAIYPTAAVTYAGNDWSGLYIWGAQLETGDFATSYIPTTAATVTRQADAALMTGANFTSWYDAAEGTLYAEASFLAPTIFAAPQSFFDVNDNTSANRLRFNRTSGSGNYLINAFGAAQVNTILSGTFTTGRIAVAYKTNDFAAVQNAGTAGTDTSGAVQTGVTNIRFGQVFDGSAVMNGTLRKFAYYPVRLTNAQLQAITG